MKAWCSSVEILKSPYFETTNDYIRDSGLLSFFLVVNGLHCLYTRSREGECCRPVICFYFFFR